MYHVAGTCLTIVILYLISFFFYRTGFYTLAFHRKLWNILLALTFLFTALAGVFMALQINYKWNIPFIKTILRWHVEIGAGAAITGILHFIWHLSYFKKIFTDSGTPVEKMTLSSSENISVNTNLFVLGFTSTSVQILLMRELMNISGGYELISGVYLGSWLITSAAGAAIAGKSGLNNPGKINLIFSASPFISLILLILFSRFFMGIGETPSFLVSMIFTLIVLLPFCLVSGFLFIKLTTIAKQISGTIPGKSFSVETTGAVTGGILLSILTSGLFNTYKIFLVITILYAAFTLLTFYILKKSNKLIAKIIFIIILSFIAISDPDIFFRQLLLPGVKVINTSDTPYGNITKGEYAGEPALYYDQRLLNYNNDVAEREEDIHYALLQRNDPEKVLMISGNLESHLAEITKYRVKKIIFIERDPLLIKNMVKKLGDHTESLIIENVDAFRYLRSNRELLNAIILMVPPPSTLSLNRFYTTEFFNNIKKRLVMGGVFMCSPGPGEDYLNNESIALYSSIYNSLTSIFKYVKPVMGHKLYFIASDEDISVSFCKLARERKIKNTYVSPDFLADDLIETKSAEVTSEMNKSIRQNREAFPFAAFHFQEYNLSRVINEKWPAITFMILAFAFPVIAVRRRNIMMYCCAAALAGFEIIALLLLQLTAGNMYQLTGLILASLMAGLAAGAGIKVKYLDTIHLKVKSFFLIIYYIGISLLLNYVLGIKGVIASIVLIILTTLVPSFLTGHIFRQLTSQGNTISSPSQIYSADLSGSALGFVLISGIAIPLLGIKSSIFLLAGLIFAGILLGTNSNK